MSDHFKFPRELPYSLNDRAARIREFETGATRNTDDHKPDFDGFLSPLSIQRYGEYMHKHRIQADGTLRASDNWQKGIPTDAYRSSLLRHTIQAWTLGRGYATVDYDNGKPVSLEDALCAIIFNAQGWLHELLEAQDFDADREGWQ